LVNISQVTVSKTANCSICSHSILNLTGWVNWLIFNFPVPSTNFPRGVRL
jgi:hypothetical protein